MTFTGRGGSNPPSDTQLPAETQEPGEHVRPPGFLIPPGSPRELAERPRDELGRLGRRLVAVVAVHVRRRRDRSVAELSAHNVEPDAGRERELGVGVPCTVERDYRDTGVPRESLKPAPQRVRLDDIAVRLGHDPRSLGAEPVAAVPPVRRAELEPLGSLLGLPRAERADSPADSPSGADSAMGKKRGHVHSLNKQGPLSVWMNSEWRHHEQRLARLESRSIQRIAERLGFVMGTPCRSCVPRRHRLFGVAAVSVEGPILPWSFGPIPAR